MTRTDILRDTEFEPVSEARIDAKHRVALGKVVGPVTSFKIYRNAHGQMLVDPMVSIPVHEAWLFKNTRAAKLVQEGLEDAKQRRLVKAKEDFSKYVRSGG